MSWPSGSLPRASGPPSAKRDDRLNKDNLLFALIGIMVGFVTGYLLQDAMAARQPPRLSQEQVAEILAGSGGPGAGPGMGQGGPGPAAPPNPGATSGDAAAAGAAPMAEIQNLRRQIEQNPNDADAIRRLADLNFEIRNWERARELYVRFLELRPGDPGALSDLGVSYRETGQMDQALESFREAQRVAPEHWQSYYNEVIVLAFDLKQFDAAEEVLARLQRMQPDNPTVSQLAAEVARQRNAA